MEKSTATLLRRHPLGETSWIVHWCSATHGLIKTVAKGARAPKSPLAGVLDLFYACDIAWAPARKGDLHYLREVRLVSQRAGLRQDYDRTLAAAYFAALLEMVAERDTPIPELHALLDKALDWIETRRVEEKVVTRYEDRVARLLGVATEGAPGAAALMHAFHRLPAQRGALLDRIRA